MYVTQSGGRLSEANRVLVQVDVRIVSLECTILSTNDDASNTDYRYFFCPMH